MALCCLMSCRLAASLARFCSVPAAAEHVPMSTHLSITQRFNSAAIAESRRFSDAGMSLLLPITLFCSISKY